MKSVVSVSAVFLLACSVWQAQAGACEHGDQIKCETSDEGCVWGYTSTGDSLEGVCRPCTEFNLKPSLCNLDQCSYDFETGECKAAPFQQPPAIVPIDAKLAYTSAVEGWAYIEMDTFSFSQNKQNAFQKAIKRTLGAEAVFFDITGPALEAEECGVAPLCGDSDTMVTDVSTYAYVPLPEMNPCCVVNETIKTRTCQTTTSIDSTCRATGLQDPFCPLGSIMSQDDSVSQRCRSLMNNSTNTYLTLDLAFLSDSSHSACCKTCNCSGDPNCNAFDGTFASWRLCDARDLDSKCTMTKSECAVTLDHDGNPCEWIGNNKGYAFWRDGAACQPSKSSSGAWLLMYQADEFALWIRQEERGVIREMVMMTSSGNYTMNANDCFAGSNYQDTWVYSGDDMDVNMVRNWKRVVTAGVSDIQWFVQDAETRINMMITCVGTKNPKSNSYGNYRLDITSLIEPQNDYATSRSNLAGFCPSGSLLSSVHSPAAIQAYYDHVERDQQCKGVERVWDTAITLDVARMLCGGQTLNSVDKCFNDFCEANAFPFTTVKECFKYFRARKLDQGFCSVAAAKGTARKECLSNVEEFGWYDSISRYFAQVKSKQVSCISDINLLPKNLEECQRGVVLQYQATPGDANSWVNYAAFPETINICNNELIVRAKDHPVLFSKALRFHQCSIPLTCGTKEICETESGISAALRYTWYIPRPTLQPTEWPTSVNPTEAPTPAPVPTYWPSKVPTEWPTKFPTKSPTENPTTKQPSNAPTRYPTKSPTKFPTKTPTEKPSRGPTGSPTEWPTNRPTKTPTKEPTDAPTKFPTKFPTKNPTDAPTKFPTKFPTKAPTGKPTEAPTKYPTKSPTKFPSKAPTEWPTNYPSNRPSKIPTEAPTKFPTKGPTDTPTLFPTKFPTKSPTKFPTKIPTESPTNRPTEFPTKAPTDKPTEFPTKFPSKAPTNKPTEFPTKFPTKAPTTKNPTKFPTKFPTNFPSKVPTTKPTKTPTKAPTKMEWPTPNPTPKVWPSKKPTSSPTSPCNPKCPNSDAMGPMEDEIINFDQCETNIKFDSGDIRDEYCGCDFDRKGALNQESENGVPFTSIDLRIACPEFVASSQRSKLENTCQLLCSEIDGCNAWFIEWRYNVCNLASCDTAYPEFEHADGVSSGLSCSPKHRPSVTPVTSPPHWTPSRRLSNENTEGESSLSLVSTHGRGLSSGLPLYKVKFTAMMPNKDSAVKVSEEVNLMREIASEYIAEEDAFNDVENSVRVVSMTMGPSYKIDDLRFPNTPFSNSVHNSQGFLNAVCRAIEVTVARQARSLNNVKCGSKLFMLSSYADSDGNLVVIYQIVNVINGKIQEMLESSAGSKELAKQLKSSSQDDVKVLGTGLDSGEEASTGLSTGTIGLIAGMCVGAVVVALGAVLLARRGKLGSSLAVRS